jgi:CRISPR-associated protein Cas2
MRVLVMFDLPVLTAENQMEYRRFRKYLIKTGFLMMQESVYCKIATNSAAATAIIENIKKNKPVTGLVQTLQITEKQYQHMDFIIGEAKSDVLDSDERLIIL